MFFHLKSLIYAFVFFLSLQILIPGNKFFWHISIFLFVFSIFVSRKINKKNSSCIMPAVFSVSTTIIIFLVDGFLIREIISIFTALTYYFIFLGIFRLKNYSYDQTARGLISGTLFANLFLFYAGFYGLYLNFAIPLWFLMLVFLTITFIMSYRYFSLISSEKRKILNYSLILGTVMAQISWVINFWPFGYLTTGIIALIFYYMFWDIAQSYFINKISKKKIVANLIFFSLIITMILATSKWQLAI